MKLDKKYLLLLAGCVWTFAGFNVLKIGIEEYVGYINIINIVLSISIYSFFQVFIFSKMVKKHTTRIISYEEKQFFLKFFDVKSFMIMAFMITFGILLRVSGVCPPLYIAVFYTGLGASLLYAGIKFIGEFIKSKKR